MSSILCPQCLRIHQPGITRKYNKPMLSNRHLLVKNMRRGLININRLKLKHLKIFRIHRVESLQLRKIRSLANLLCKEIKIDSGLWLIRSRTLHQETRARIQGPLKVTTLMLKTNFWSMTAVNKYLILETLLTKICFLIKIDFKIQLICSKINLISKVVP